ncbi:hillarin isoform X2 [Eurytemora carolleeae]|uniref:hillarin isoform X2 n=1 Tax=Eurytemora carolleeae TaxID=1294199 RepID=UPI000C78412B|nr:hillarin isoform X2 [Eurytemora carolleeae]|eukprot:XP_023319784.1 hillarin-like isoform X2 [Eurytemora affinis]
MMDTNPTLSTPGLLLGLGRSTGVEEIRPRGSSKEFTPRLGRTGTEEEIIIKPRPWVAKAREIEEIKPRFTRDVDSPRFGREEIKPRVEREVFKPRFEREEVKPKFDLGDGIKPRFSPDEDSLTKPRSLHDDNYSSLRGRSRIEPEMPEPDYLDSDQEDFNVSERKRDRSSSFEGRSKKSSGDKLEPTPSKSGTITRFPTFNNIDRVSKDRDLSPGSKYTPGTNYQVQTFNETPNPEESKHFLSLQIFSAHAEPPLEEFLNIKLQLELEERHREEEDALYRAFLQERREQETRINNMGEEEREELFINMNKMERSRIINLTEKHCDQMMDLIHREKIKYLEEGGEETKDIHQKYPREPPPIEVPRFTKDQVYENNMAVFEAVDEVALKAAGLEHRTLTGVARMLVNKCSSDLDKARAIFRFISERKFKHLSWFLYYPEEGNKRGAPTNLFRGVEFGIETKALLYKKMCAYVGLHAIVIKGYSKAKDYIPGDEFVDERWRSAWNGVYVAGGWRLVQANWASMQINTKAARETRQMYQDHYFLTDPDKFIFEFFPLSAEFQFLEHPVTKSEFENLPLLRSTFFHLGLSLARSEGLLNAVVEANDMGEANIYLNSKADTSFHYTLYNCKNGSTSIKAPGGKFPLDRFVLMSTKDKETTFNVHIPQKGSFLLEIGAVKYPSSAEFLASPIHYINVCKFKIITRKVDKVMVPLPDCVPGEWGPEKAIKLFGLKPTSHPMPIIYAAPPSNIDLRNEVRPLTLNIEFEKTDEVLDFVTKLYKNGVHAQDLKQGSRYRNKDKYVIFDIKVPQDGQYGLDIYIMNKSCICLGPPGWTVRVGYLYNEYTLYMSRSLRMDSTGWISIY